MTNSPITDRLFPERCFLNYVFLGSNDPVIRKVPFYSNINISESRKPSYDIKTGANQVEPTYNYVRTDSKKIDLSFTLNLNHFIESNSIFSYQNTETNEEKKTIDKLKFSIETSVNDNPVPYSKNLRQKYLKNEIVFNSYMDTYSYYSNLRYKRKDPVFPTFGDPFTPLLPAGFLDSYSNKPISTKKLYTEEVILSKISQLQFEEDDLENQAIYKQLDAFIYMINLFRSGVLNKEGQTGLPPIIFLNYGVLYQNVPCLCINYDIKIQEDTPYELGSLLPHHIKVDISLVEARDYIEDQKNENNDASLLEQFDAVYSIVGDAVNGWSSVINKPFSLDISPQTNIILE